MVKLLIVDDEATIRKGLSTVIKWDNYGINVCGAAESGLEALSMIEQNAPDIVLLDIMMSDMDGLEVLEVLNKKYPNIKVILISGHDEFEFAQKAIELNAFCYILKPIDINNLLEKVLEAKKQIEITHEKIKADEELNRRLKESLPMLKESFLFNLMLGKLKNHEYILDKADFLNIKLKNVEYLVVIFEIQNIKDNNSINEYNKNLFNVSIIRTAEEHLGKIYNIYPLNINDRNVILITFTKISMKSIVNECTFIRDWTNQTLSLPIATGIGQIYNDPVLISHSFKEATEALEYKVLLGENEIIEYEKIYRNDTSQAIKNSLMLKLDEVEDELLSALKTLNKEKVEDIVLRIITELTNVIESDIKNANWQLFLLSFFLSKIVISLKINNEKILSHGYDLYNKLCGMETVREIKAYIADYLNMILNELENSQTNYNNLLVKRVIEYLKENIYNNITLTDAAEFVYISPNHLSKIFKQNMGETFINYVVNLKMNEAKKLLKNSSFKIYEISEKLGYKDVNYFSKNFKRIFNVTPSEYR